MIQHYVFSLRCSKCGTTFFLIQLTSALSLYKIFSMYNYFTDFSHFSCYSHAIALTTRAFANALSCGKLKSCAAKIVSQAPDDVDDGMDETDEDVDALLSVLTEAVDMEKGVSSESKMLAKILVKVRAFIVKVRFSYVFSLLVFIFLSSKQQVRRSPSAKKYFKNCVQSVPSVDTSARHLELVQYCETRWETWEAVLKRFILLKQVLASVDMQMNT